MASFFFNPQAGETPEMLMRRRALAEAMLERGSTAMPSNVGEGLSAIGQALGGRMRLNRIGKKEGEYRKSAVDLANSILGMGGGKASAPGVGTISSAAPPSVAPSGGGSSSYRDAIAGIESGGRYDIVGPTHPKLGRALGKYQIMEANIGPWSRETLGREVTPDEFLANPEIQDTIFDKKFGGYVSEYGPEGAAQAWFAGPGGVGKLGRKDVLGTTVGSYGDKFMQALGGSGDLPPPDTMASDGINRMTPEQARVVAAASGGRQAPDLSGIDPQSMQQRMPQGMTPEQAYFGPEAAIPRAGGMQPGQPAVTSDAGRRVMETMLAKQPMGGSPMIRMPEQAAPQQQMAQPQAPMQVAQAQQQFDPRIVQALQNPYLPDGYKMVLQALLKQQMEQADPMRSLEMDFKREQLNQLRNPREEVPDSVRALDERARRAGLQPGTREYNEFMISGGSKGITVDARQMGNIPPGYRAEYDEQGRVTQLVPIEGGPAAAEAQAAEDAAISKTEQQQRYGNVVVEDIDRAVKQIEEAPWFTTGLLGQWSQGVAGTPAHRVSKLLDTVKANAGFDRLQAMRDSSPTGGALGQVSNIELGLLQSAIGSLEQSNNSEDLVYNLRRVQQIYNDIIHGPGNTPTQGEGAEQKPLSEMSDEELEAIINGDR